MYSNLICLLTKLCISASQFSLCLPASANICTPAQLAAGQCVSRSICQTPGYSKCATKSKNEYDSSCTSGIQRKHTLNLYATNIISIEYCLTLIFNLCLGHRMLADQPALVASDGNSTINLGVALLLLVLSSLLFSRWLSQDALE